MSGTVSPIRPRRKIPKANRKEDQETILFAQMAASCAREAHDLAQTEPGSTAHVQMLALSGISDKLPRNNLRIIANYGIDEEARFWTAYRRWEAASTESAAVEASLSLACHIAEQEGGNKARIAVYDEWSERRRESRKKRDDTLVDLLRQPVSNDWHHSLKMKAAGGRKWVTRYRPEWAAILNEEAERLAAAKAERKAIRTAKKAQG